MPAMAATKPTMFSHAVNHAHRGPPSSADQWYMPPDVGRAEQRSGRRQRPAQSHFARAAHGEAVVKERDCARQNGNNGKRNGEIRKAAEASEELLSVAEAGEIAGVFLGALMFPMGLSVIQTNCLKKR